jgi:transposase
MCTAHARNPKLFLRTFKHSIKYPDVIRTLKELRRHVKGRLILVWDGLRSHWAAETKAYVKTQHHWLMVRRFPSYAPALNPVEYLWSASKSKDLAGLYVDIIDDMDVHIKNSKRRFQRRPDLLAGFLKAAGLFENELST